MGFVLALFSFLFLIAGLATQLISYLTPYMYVNTLITNNHQGLFRRCIFASFISNPVNTIGNVLTGSTSATGCNWWTLDNFKADPRWLQAIMVLAMASAGIVGLLLLFSMTSLIPRFKSRRIRVFIAFLSCINAIVLGAIVAIYTTLNDVGIKFNGGTVNYSWSYWLLYGSIGSFLFTSVFFACNKPSFRDRD